jgi:hypothetical protein
MHGSRWPGAPRAALPARRRVVAATLAGLAGLAATAATAAPAAAEDRDHGQPAPFPRWSRGFFFAGHGGSVAGISFGGFGVSAEVARGRGRWQLFGDATMMWTAAAVNAAPPAVALSDTPPAEEPEGADGFEGRIGFGARRLVRSFEPDHSAAIEMYLEGGAGVSRVWWNGGGTLTRPDVSFGGGWQVRGFESPRFTVRLALKVLVQAPVDDSATAALCTGTCPEGGHHGTEPGFLAQIGASW